MTNEARNPRVGSGAGARVNVRCQLMEARIHVLTLAVADLERALLFYREGLGLESPGVVATEFSGDSTTAAGAIAMFQLDGGLMLALYPRTELAKDANIAIGAAQSGEFSTGHLVDSEAEVDPFLSHAEAAGALLTDQTHYRPWGIYSR